MLDKKSFNKMSRSCSVQLVLQDPEAKVKSIKPSGDCFYEAIATAFTTIKEDVRDYEDVFVEDDDDQAMALRRFTLLNISLFSTYFVSEQQPWLWMRRCSVVSPCSTWQD